MPRCASRASLHAGTGVHITAGQVLLCQRPTSTPTTFLRLLLLLPHLLLFHYPPWPVRSSPTPLSNYRPASGSCQLEARCTGDSPDCPVNNQPDGYACPWAPARKLPKHGYHPYSSDNNNGDAPKAGRRSMRGSCSNAGGVLAWLAVLMDGGLCMGCCEFMRYWCL